MIKVRDTILKIWSITWLIAFIFTVIDVQRNKPRFKFNSSGMSWNRFERDWKKRYKLSISWILKNQSLIPNSLNVVHTVVWANKSKYSVLRHSVWVNNIISHTDNNSELKLPILLAGYEAKNLLIVSEFIVEWTSDMEILSQYTDTGWWRMRPKYEYKLLFEDTNENIFDEYWYLCNMEESWLRRTLPNTMHSLKNWNPKEFILHYLEIFVSQIKFWFKKIARYLGILK